MSSEAAEQRPPGRLLPLPARFALDRQSATGQFSTMRALSSCRFIPWLTFGLLIGLLPVSSALHAQDLVAVPPLSSPATDLTGTLSEPQLETLRTMLGQYARDKGSQLALLIVPTTAPEEIEQYSIRVVEEWKLGRKGVDDGILLLIAKDDRKMRLEVGYGLEGALPDARAKQIIAEVITPYFKNGEFYEGIEIGLQTVIATIKNEPLPEPKYQPAAMFAGSFEENGWIHLMVLFFATMIVGAWCTDTPFLRRLIVAMVYGGLIFLAGLLFVSAFWSAIAAAVPALFILIAKYLPASSSSSGSSSGSSWSSSSSSSRSYSSSSSSSSSYSGGGGSFGGGGASGSW